MYQKSKLSAGAGQTPRRPGGFSLIELVVVMVIAAILAAIAIPAYSSYVRKSRRTEAKAALLDIASLEERYFSTQNKYTNTPSDLGYSGAWPITVGSGYYTVSVPAPGIASAPTPALPAGVVATYSATATATGDQTKDTQCLSFTVMSNGTQNAFTSANVDNTAACWH